MHPVYLRLDPASRRTLENLNLMAAQIPATAFANPSLIDDAHAVFRLAKAILVDAEPRPVSVEDVAKSLRFAVWVLASPGAAGDQLKPWIAEVALQIQTQDSNFESVLKAYGVDRRLELEERSRIQNGVPALRQSTTTLHQVRIRLTKDGTELASQTLSRVNDYDPGKSRK